jgi:thiol-disulfide isomerase/thioredoxin
MLMAYALFSQVYADVDERIALAYHLKCTPTFQLYENGQEVDHFEGGNEERLKSAVTGKPRSALAVEADHVKQRLRELKPFAEGLKPPANASPPSLTDKLEVILQEVEELSKWLANQVHKSQK